MTMNMRPLLTLLLLVLLSCGLAVGQVPNPASIGLPDAVKFGRAIDDSSVLTPKKLMPLRKLDLKATSITMASFKAPSHAKGGCAYAPDDIAYYQRNGIWVFVPDELREIFAGRAGEFKDAKLRMRELLGLNPDPSYKYECILLVTIDPKELVRPSLALDLEKGENSDFIKGWGGSFPFVGLGYTCDWYYGDGCRYGMSEFFIPGGRAWTGTKSCALDEYLKAGCRSAS
jgi:hypothetical protein